MSYDTLYFALFLAVVWTAFRLLPGKGWVLLAASIVFYAAAGPQDAALAAFLIAANYAAQLAIGRERRWLYAILALNFGCLAYFKYRVFLAASAGFDLYSSDIIIPLGISFYIFQLSAFMIDLADGRATAFASLARFSLFVLFFGQLVAGPIMRWEKLGPQVNRLFDGVLRRHRLLSLGLGLCVLGLIKKVVLADSIAPVVDTVFREGPADAAAAWMGAWLFGFQIYFDFSGYSDVALGLGYLFGIRLAVNFRQPYLVRTPQLFWRHWHITLSQWIRDYLYIPLGGSRGPLARGTAVLFIAMGLAGLWHGANVTFIVWGLGWAALIVVWRLAGGALARLGPGEWVLLLVLTVMLWVFFRAGDVASALGYLETMFGRRGPGTATVPADGTGGMLVLAGCASLLALHWAEAQLFTRRFTLLLKRNEGALLRGFLVGVAVWLVLIPKPFFNPFIYFRF